MGEIEEEKRKNQRMGKKWIFSNDGKEEEEEEEEEEG